MLLRQFVVLSGMSDFHVTPGMYTPLSPALHLSVNVNVSVRFVSLQYMSNVDSWCKACGEVDLPSELQDLEDAIHHHQGLYEHITAAYSEVTPHFIYIFNVKLRVENYILHHKNMDMFLLCKFQPGMWTGSS